MISVNIQNLEKVQSDFNAITQRLMNPQTGMEIVAGKGFKDVVDHFSEEESPDGKWQSLKKPRKRGGSKILQDTGRLRSSVRFRTLRDEAHIFTQVVYAGVHNFGYSKRNIPQRQFLWLSKEAIKSITETFKRFILGK